MLGFLLEKDVVNVCLKSAGERRCQLLLSVCWRKMLQTDAGSLLEKDVVNRCLEFVGERCRKPMLGVCWRKMS